MAPSAELKTQLVSLLPVWTICLLMFFGLCAGVYLFQAKPTTNALPTDIANEPTTPNNPTKPLPAIESKRELTFFAVGDIMLSRTVSDKIRKYGFNYPFAKTNEYLNSADFAFGNLETSITAGPNITAGMMSFRADPGVENALKRANFQVVSLANNHTPNFGQNGLLDTFSYLKKAGISYAGAGSNSIEAHQPAIIERNGIKLAFLAYNDTDVVPASYGASANRAGTALMNITELKKDIAAIKPTVDFVIVSMHSGTEYTSAPNNRQTDFAHAAIDAGTELVIGHHPHVVQTIETYKDKLIMYSLGNFVFDQMWSEDTRHGVTAKIIVDEDGVEQAAFSPIIIDDYSQPRPAAPGEASAILKRLDANHPPTAIELWEPKR
ncbi:MAG: CapA family protein [Patescibacteria group bacterium]